MTRRAWMTLQIAIALMVAAGSLMVNDRVLTGASDSVVTTADARVGRPLTPMSYAGVARRTTRRAVAIGAAAAPVVVAPRGCVQVVDAYGRIVTRCY